MGLFSKMFQKKSCVHCQKELGLTGWRSLSDGFLCKDCTRLLSPFFTERKESSSDEILQQLQYRKENEQLLPRFRADELYGDRGYVVCIDRSMQAFLVSGRGARDWQQGNPDIVRLDAVRDVQFDVDETRWELHRKDEQGHDVSFNPPRFRYDYRFSITILVDHPWFDRMNFTLESGVSGDEPETFRYWAETGMAIQQAFGFQVTLPMMPRPSDPLPQGPMDRPGPRPGSGPRPGEDMHGSPQPGNRPQGSSGPRQEDAMRGSPQPGNRPQGSNSPRPADEPRNSNRPRPGDPPRMGDTPRPGRNPRTVRG